MNNWMNALFKTAKKQNMYRGKRNSKGMMWVSLLGLAVSAAAYGIKRNRNVSSPVKNLMNNFQFKNGKMANAMTEFSTELVPYKEEKK